ncbi:MAG: hypothetical protein U0R24_03390 [Solirubrobacterales bacterium]
MTSAEAAPSPLARRADGGDGIGETLRRAEERADRFPVAAVGLVLSILTWFVTIAHPGTGLDQGWIAGMYMGIEHGIRFGPDFVFTYGPLGFLNFATDWYVGLANLAYLWLAALHVVFTILLVAALRRSLGMLAAIAIAFLVLCLLPAIEVPFAIGALACFFALRLDRPRFALDAVVFGGAAFAAAETLVKLSVGPVLFLMFAVALVGARARPWQLGAYLLAFAGTFVGLWLASGQVLGDLPDFVVNGRQIISGYSEAMSTSEGSELGYTFGVLGAVVILIGLVASSSFAGYRERLARWSGVLVAALVGFALFKEGVVRFDIPHMGAYASTIAVVWVALPWARAQWVVSLTGALVLLLAGAALQHHEQPSRIWTLLNPIDNVQRAWNETRSLTQGDERREDADKIRFLFANGFSVDKSILDDIEGKRVSVEPWEIAAAWTFDLQWDPTPVIQGYQANTQALDELNAEAISSPDGMERILRHSPDQITRDWSTRSIDDRWPGWDPPAQTLATLCNFEITTTTPGWQLLSRVPDRCGEPELISSVDSAFGETVEVPQPGRDEVVYAKVEGAGVSGAESILSLLYKARFRHAVVNGTDTYRLVPGTAADGLLLAGPPELVGEGIFAQAPQASTLELTGPGGDLRYDFYSMKVEPTANERAAARADGGDEG